ARREAHAREAQLPHGLGRVLPPVRLAGGGLRRPHGRAARRRRKRGARRLDERSEADDQGRRRQRRALRLLPQPAGDASAPRRVPPGPGAAIRRRERRSPPAGAVRGPGAPVYLGWFVDPHPSKPFVLDETSYLRARQTVANFWTGELAGAATYEVPEQRVNDAERSLLIQNATLAWCYSVGNTYEELSNAEMMEAAQVMGEFGFAGVD